MARFRVGVVVKPVALMLGVVVASFALTGCTPEEPSEPSSEATSSPTAVPTSTPSAEPVVVAIPETCEELVPISWIHAQYGSDIEAIPITEGLGSGDVEEYRSRGGLACMWGLPASEFGVTVFVAPRATATDAEQIAQWEAAGYTLGPDFLDATYYEHIVDDFGEHMTVWTLVEGFELKSQTPSSSVDPLLIILREATENMGYV